MKNQSTQQLEKWTRPSLNFGMYNGQVELHFFLQWDSSTTANTPYFLALENQGVDSIRIRCITDSGIQTLPTIGREISYHVRGNRFRYFVWPLTNSKTHQLEIVANCFVFYHSLQLPFSLHTRQHYYEKENQTN
ncbi:MAG TPA: hypothetical protein PLU10_05305, partial [Chitinophagaceae bacterium]|nr:hypothetical protein [Chitinophagaceae bacterium]